MQERARAVARYIGANATGALRKFYGSRGYWPLWAATGTMGPEARAFVGWLETADLDGLRPSRYGIAGVDAALDEARGGDPAAVARAELSLSRAFSRYVADVRRIRRTEMEYADPALKPKKLSPEAALRTAATPLSFNAYVTTMGWMSPHYVRLRALLATARERGAPEDVLDRIRVNLDRARVLPGPWVHHIVVDAASARLWYYQGGEQQGVMKVVVGAPETETPMIAGYLNYAILNPYWNVPTYLARKSIAPKVIAGRSLKAMRIEALSDWSETPRVLNAAAIDWHAVAAGEQEVRLRELPGRDNSMGKVKFLFPNDEGIYLHDTPDRALLAKPARHFSNGCIRLENAAALGEWLLGRPITKVSSTPEQLVPLPVPVPVYVTYLTATPTTGGVGFLDDVYHRDE